MSSAAVSEHRIDPLRFEGTLNSYLGSAFSVEPTLRQSARLRPHNLSEDIANLYFVGAGLAGVMSSAKIVGNMIGNCC